MLNTHSCQTDLILKLLVAMREKKGRITVKHCFRVHTLIKELWKGNTIAVFYSILSSPFNSYIILCAVFYTSQKPMTFFSISLLVSLLPFNKKYLSHNNYSKSSYLFWTKIKRWSASRLWNIFTGKCLNWKNIHFSGFTVI